MAATSDIQARMRRIPSVDQLLDRPSQQALRDTLPADLVTAAVRAVLDDLRTALRADSAPADALDETRLDAAIQARIDAWRAPRLRPVVNATGVVIHTNLGRAPLGDDALGALVRVGGGYCNLEYDLEAGSRGSRHEHVADLFHQLTGAEAALVVNNNAAAVVLILAALASGREVVVSRGELIEIGGSFRLPEIMAQSGAVLREVGSTNRTRIGDYAAALGDDTALLLKAHRSNFAIVGFTESVDLSELVALGRAHDIPVVEDLGSGSLVELGRLGVPGPTSVAARMALGPDLICFSGDKLLGGPQCGVILGRRALVDKLRKHPLTRALRIDKLTIAALEATVRAYLDGRHVESLPVLAALAANVDELRRRAENLAAEIEGLGLPGLAAEPLATQATVGGGSLPGTEIPSWGVALNVAGVSAAALERALRTASIPVVSRVADDRVVWDLRTVSEDRLSVLVAALREVVPMLVPRPAP